MTTGICQNTNVWATGKGLNAKNGATARIYSYDAVMTADGTLTAGSQLITDVQDTDSSAPNYYDSTNYASAADQNLQQNMALGVGTFALTDSRDGNDYLVRRLGDGNCWMVQNLDLDLSTVGTLTPTDTNIIANWNPYAKSGGSSVSAFEAYSLAQLGNQQPTQYQNSTQFSNQGGIKWTWGSLLDEAGSPVASAQNNSRSVLARSYNNTIYAGETIDGTGVRGSMTGVRYIPTNPLTGATTGYDSSYTDHIYETATAADRNSSAIANDTAGRGENNFYGSMYIGKYYNWYAATAETGNFSATTPSGDICPKGWQLPVASEASSRKSWYNLIYYAYGLIDNSGAQTDSNNPYGDKFQPALRMRQIPLSAVFSGGYYGLQAYLGGRGHNGFYWSSSPNNSTHAYYLYLGDIHIYPNHTDNKTGGLTVRCVAQ